MVSPGMAVAALSVRLAPMPRPAPLLALTQLTLVVRVCPSVSLALAAIQAVVIVGIGWCDGHRCDHRHRVLDHQRRAGGITGAIAVGGAGCAHHRLTRLNALSAQRLDAPTAQGHTRAAIAPGIGGAELLGVRIADRGAAADAAGGGHPAGRLDADAADAGRAVGDLHAVRGIHTLAIGIGGRDGALHHIGGADAAGAQRHRRPAAQARARAEILPAVAETGQAAVGVHRHTAAAEGARGGHPVGRRDGRSAGELRSGVDHADGGGSADRGVGIRHLHRALNDVAIAGRVAAQLQGGAHAQGCSGSQIAPGDGLGQSLAVGIAAAGAAGQQIGAAGCSWRMVTPLSTGAEFAINTEAFAY